MVNDDAISLLRSHSSVRQFEDMPVSQRTVDIILKCTQRAPTSSNLQAYTIIQVEDKAKRRALKEYSGGQAWLEDAPLVFLFCGDLFRSQQLLQPEDRHVLHNAELFTVAVTDASLAAQRALITAQACGLGGVIVGGIRNETAKTAELFELPELVFPLFAMCLGYPKVVPVQRPRLETRFIHAVDRYPTLPTERELADYDEQILRYFQEHTNDPNVFGWVAREQHAIASKPRYSVAEFLHDAGFLTETEPYQSQ